MPSVDASHRAHHLEHGEPCGAAGNGWHAAADAAGAVASNLSRGLLIGNLVDVSVKPGVTLSQFHDTGNGTVTPPTGWQNAGMVTVGAGRASGGGS